MKFETGNLKLETRGSKLATRHLPLVTVALLLCSSCALIPLPEHEVALPEAYRQQDGEVHLLSNWWATFGDEQLNGLVAQTLSDNLTIEQASARLRQTEAIAVKSGAARFPSLTGNGSGATTYTGSRTAPTVTADNFTLGLSASYELDLWGRVASSRRAALSALDASRYSLQTAAMTVSAETVLTYFRWQQLNARLDLLTEQLAARRKMLSVVEERFKTSKANALTVLLQRENVAAAEAVIPPVRDSLQAAGNALAILTGRPPQTDLGLVVKPLPNLPGRPDAGLPADLMAMRPDLQASWAALEQADWNVRAAQAARLPALTLTGSVSTSDQDVDNLFDNWIGNLAAGLAMPLIDGGSRRAEARRAQAASDEAVAVYREAVYNALAEVEDALSAENSTQEELAAVVRQSDFAASAADEAYRRYTRGLASFYDALNSRTSSQSRQLNELSTRYSLIAARVQLCRVLGGDWETLLEEHYE